MFSLERTFQLEHGQKYQNYMRLPWDKSQTSNIATYVFEEIWGERGKNENRHGIILLLLDEEFLHLTTTSSKSSTKKNIALKRQ